MIDITLPEGWRYGAPEEVAIIQEKCPSYMESYRFRYIIPTCMVVVMVDQCTRCLRTDSLKMCGSLGYRCPEHFRD